MSVADASRGGAGAAVRDGGSSSRGPEAELPALRSANLASVHVRCGVAPAGDAEAGAARARGVPLGLWGVPVPAPSVAPGPARCYRKLVLIRQAGGAKARRNDWTERRARRGRGAAARRGRRVRTSAETERPFARAPRGFRTHARRREPRTAAGVPRDGRKHGEPRQRQHGRSIARRIRVGGAARRAGKRTWDRGRARRTRLRGSCDARSRSSEPHAPSALSSVARPLRPSEDRRRSSCCLGSLGRKSHPEDGKIPTALGCVFLFTDRLL